MPIYDYKCEKCGHTFDVMQKITADPLKECPEKECPQEKHGKGKVTKQISLTSFQLKGTGWYKTDYKD